MQGGDAEEQGMDVSNVDAVYEEFHDRLVAVDLAVGVAAAAAQAHAKLAKVRGGE